MSAEGDPKPAEPEGPPPPPAPEAPSPSASQGITRLRLTLEAKRRRLARRLLHVRYVFGYLAAGFLVSVPISLGSRVGAGGLTPFEAVKESAISVLYGLVLYLPFFALIPFSRVDWKAMRVPEFQLFELSVTRTATIAALVLLLLSVQLHVFSQLAEPRLVWTVLVLMLFAWGRIKVQTLIFPEFYAGEHAPNAEPPK